MLIALLISVPLVTALVGQCWDALWDTKVVKPIPSALDVPLRLAQAAGLVLLAIRPAVGLGLLAAVYAVMAAGITVLRSRGVRGDCGCFGSTVHLRLGRRLAAFDALLAVLPLGVLLGPGYVPSPSEARVGMAGAVIVATAVALVVVPGRRLIREAADMAAPFRRGVFGYRDVPEADT